MTYFGIKINSIKMKTSHDILHWISLQKILEILIEHYWFEGLDSRLTMNCFHNKPSMHSSLKFLRTTPWAREKVEALYIEYIRSRDT